MLLDFGGEIFWGEIFGEKFFGENIFGAMLMAGSGRGWAQLLVSCQECFPRCWRGAKLGWTCWAQPQDWAQAEDLVLSVKHCRALLMFQELWEVSCPCNTAPQNIPGLGQHGEHQKAAPAELQQEGKDSSQPAHALYKTCCFCLVVFSKCSLLKPLSYCAGFLLKYMFRLVT